MTASVKQRLDRTDIGILNQLQQNARITNSELARAVNLSPTPCFNRVRALEKAGFTREGVLRGAQFRRGEWHDLVSYARLRNDP